MVSCPLTQFMHGLGFHDSLHFVVVDAVSMHAMRRSLRIASALWSKWDRMNGLPGGCATSREKSSSPVPSCMTPTKKSCRNTIRPGSGAGESSTTQTPSSCARFHSSWRAFFSFTPGSSSWTPGFPAYKENPFASTPGFLRVHAAFFGVDDGVLRALDDVLFVVHSVSVVHEHARRACFRTKDFSCRKNSWPFTKQTPAFWKQTSASWKKTSASTIGGAASGLFSFASTISPAQGILVRQLTLRSRLCYEREGSFARSRAFSTRLSHARRPPPSDRTSSVRPCCTPAAPPAAPATSPSTPSPARSAKHSRSHLPARCEAPPRDGRVWWPCGLSRSTLLC